MPSVTKSYQEHIQQSKGCSHRWRLLESTPHQPHSAGNTPNKFLVVPCRCKSKSCLYCRRIYFTSLRRRINKVHLKHEYRFFTLTTVKTDETIQEQLEKLETYFRKLRNKLSRENENFQYIAVKELAPDGMWHIHGLWNIYIDVKRLSFIWNSISRAYRVNLQKIRNPRGAINYILAYCINKAINHDEEAALYTSGKKKFTASQKFFQKETKSKFYRLREIYELTTTEIKEKLLEIVETTNCKIDDFICQDYPYWKELLFHLFEFHYENPDQQSLAWELPANPF